MRSAIRLLQYLLCAASLAACGDVGVAPGAGSVTALHASAGPTQVRYVVTHLESPGGNGSRGNVISNRGWVAGYSHPDAAQVRVATLWRDGTPYVLGTLGGEDSNSNVAWAGVNNRGMVVGITETGELDEFDQPWSCRGFFPAGTPAGRRCVGFFRADGRMTELPALGGSNSYAAGINNRGQIVGWAETAVLDPTCRDGQVRQFRAVMWEPARGITTELPPLPGDSASAATAISESGRIVGISGECDQAVGRATARHAVIWESGVPRRLETLDGDSWHTPVSINDSGEIVGFSLASAGIRAVHWSRTGKLTNIGTLPDDAASQANGINARGEVVGVSYGGPAGPRAFLWKDGVLVDLNALASGYEGTLLEARHINDRGVITGSARHPESGEVVPFVATPTGG